MKILISKILYIIVLLTPLNLFAQTVEDSLSPEAKALVEQAKTQPQSSSNKTRFFQMGLTSRFHSFLNVNQRFDVTTIQISTINSLEFYFGEKRSRLLLTGRFGAPIIGFETFGYSQYIPGFSYGLGVGVSSIMKSNRDPVTGKGSELLFNMLFTFDYHDGSRLYAYNNNGNYTIMNHDMLFAIDFESRYVTYFSKHFGLVVGFGFTAGINSKSFGQELGIDGYPIIPLKDFGTQLLGYYSAGVTIGFMF